MSAENSYYEQEHFWKEERYLQNSEELRRFKTLAEIIPADVESLVDIGCGNGAFLKILEQAGRPPVLAGLERSSKAIEMSLCDVTIQEGSSDALPFGAEQFDIVSACEVIEHLPYRVYESTLSEIARVARRYVLISVPYREERRFVCCPYCGTEFPSYFHLRTFDEEYLKSLFPGFILANTKLIEVATKAFSLHPRVYWNRLWKHRNALGLGQICPLCNYSSPPMTTSEPPRVGCSRRIKRHLNSLVPRVQRAKWIVALYGRAGL